MKIFTAITNLALFALMVLSVFVLGNRVYADDTRYLYQTLSQRQADTGRDYNNSEARNFLPVIPQQQRFAPAQPIFNPDLVPPPELPRMQEYRFRGAGSPYRRAQSRETAASLEKISASPLERTYSKRAGHELHQFGYDMFGVPRQSTAQAMNAASLFRTPPPSGTADADFVLGEGDALEIVLRGQRSERFVREVNSRGQLLIDDFPPIPAAGRTLGQVRYSVEAAASNLFNMEAHLSLAAVRRIGVLVIGHVAQPGRQNLTVFHTVLDALMGAGGVEKTGTLRQIRLVRDGRSTIIDLYNLLMQGSADIDLRLRDGDRIIVPPIGPTVGAAGAVKRPGIYEILGGGLSLSGADDEAVRKLSLNDMLGFAGGVLTSGQNHKLRLSANAQGQERAEAITADRRKVFGDGDILLVSRGTDRRANMVELSGHAAKSGTYSLDNVENLSDLLTGPAVLKTGTYPLFGVIERWNNKHLSTELYHFPLNRVLSGDYDMALSNEDKVILLAQDQIHALFNQDSAGQHENSGGMHLAAFSQMPLAFADSDHRAQNGHGGEDDKQRAENLPPRLEAFIREHAVMVRGSVRSPGAYPISHGTTLESLLVVAGGLTLDADKSALELTTMRQGPEGRMQVRRKINMLVIPPGDVELTPGDTLRINQKFKAIEEGGVVIAGQVTRPGAYDLVQGDRLSDLLQRAGGLGPYAYPDGTIFSRASEREAEENRYRAAARNLKQAIALAMDSDDPPAPAEVAQAQDLINELENISAVGRITVEADPEVLSARPELDILLEKGDRIFIPKRPSTVRVAGEVLSPAALQFEDEKSPRDYIREAGGLTFNADKDRTFVLYPDGAAQPVAVSSWNYNPVFIPPGSTVVVPRDPKPFDFIQSAKDISQILSNLAITGVFIDDVRDDD